MGRINIYSVPSFTEQVIDARVESVGTNTFTVIEEQTPSPNFLVGAGEVVKVNVLSDGVTKTIYTVYKNQTYDGTDYRLILGYDEEIYGDYIDVNTNIESIYYYEPVDADKIVPVDLYSVISELSVATYSKQYKPYNVSESYSLSIPRRRYNFTTTLKRLYLGYDEKILVDACDNKCYRVSPGELTANSLNNKFSSAVTLNVLIK